MDSMKLRALTEAVRLGSLTEAAKELGYTQAGLTQMMNRLEDEMGVLLLKRANSGVALTEDGEKLLPQINRCITATENLEKKIREIKSEKVTTLKIGAYTSMINTWLPTVVNSYRKRRPDIKIELTSCDVSKMYELFDSSAIDIGFGGDHPFPYSRFERIFEDPFFAVLPKGESKAFDGAAPISYFDQKPFLVSTFGFEPDVMPMLIRSGVKPEMKEFSVMDFELVRLVNMGMGVSILPKLVLDSVDCSEVDIVPLEPAFSRYMGVVLPEENSKSPLVKEFIAYSEKEIAAIVNTKPITK